MHTCGFWCGLGVGACLGVALMVFVLIVGICWYDLTHDFDIWGDEHGEDEHGEED